MTTGFQLRQAARTLRAGGLVLYPTEGVWGLGCDPLNPGAVAAVLTLKSRPVSKGLILIARQRAQLAPFVSEPDAIPETETPTTWVVPATAHCLPWLTGGRQTIAVRLTTHPVAASLCEAFGGAVVSTSANPGGRPAPRRLTQLHPRLRAEADYLLAGACGGLGGPTPIRVLGTGEWTRGGQA